MIRIDHPVFYKYTKMHIIRIPNIILIFANGNIQIKVEVCKIDTGEIQRHSALDRPM